jgi:hypothetical protein
MSLRRCIVWPGAAVLVVLLGRAIGYAAEPDPTARLYGEQLGGPSLPAIALVALALGSAAAVAVCWLAALGVRERRLLERRVLVSLPPALRPGRIAIDAIALWAITAPAAGLLEAYVHWRAGLGWHGLNCLVGPVHRDLLPVLAALCLVATAVIAAADHVLAWMRRVLAVFAPAPLEPPSGVTVWSPLEWLLPRERFRAARWGARAPPARV